MLGLLPQIKKTIKVVFLLSVLLFFISLHQKNKLPDKKQIHQELYQEPIQTEVKGLSFEREVKGITYNIVALFRYKLYGLVVSFEDCSSWTNYYNEQAKDFINSKDICVIWGENIANEVYKQMRFSSDAWTCQYSFKSCSSQEAARFKNYCLSNNHLLASDENINKIIREIRRGDQVYLEGYLVKYTAKNWNGNWRVTSTSRTDHGCEVIFVNKIEIFKKANVFWNFLYSFSKYIFLGCIIILSIIFFKEPVSRVNSS